MKEISFEFKVPKIQFSPELKQGLKIVISIAWMALVFLVGMRSFDFTFVESLILVYFGFSIILSLDSRISAALALFFLIGCPVLLYTKNDALAETFAVYAFYFLVITVVGEIIALFTGEKTAANLPVDNSPRQPKRKVV